MTFHQAQQQLVVTDADKGFDPLGRFYDFVINPDTGKCEAIWVQSLFGLRILFADDINRWQDDLIHVNSAELLHKPENLPRLKKIFDCEIAIMHARVFQGQQMLGTVKNFWFDTISPRIVKILVKKNWLPWSSTRIIESNYIQSITTDGIIISESTLKTASKPDTKDISELKKIVQEPGMEKVEIKK
jgi:sporulation protein YlmC with PRC-barrel domain